MESGKGHAEGVQHSVPSDDHRRADMFIRVLPRGQLLSHPIGLLFPATLRPDYITGAARIVGQIELPAVDSELWKLQISPNLCRHCFGPSAAHFRLFDWRDSLAGILLPILAGIYSVRHADYFGVAFHLLRQYTEKSDYFGEYSARPADFFVECRRIFQESVADVDRGGHVLARHGSGLCEQVRAESRLNACNNMSEYFCAARRDDDEMRTTK